MAQVTRPRAGDPRVTDERDDGSVVIEADAAEDAIEVARERFGDAVEIIEVRRLVRGGVKGFFAREYFSVTAGPPRSTRPPEPPVGAPPAGVRPEVDALVRQISRVGAAPTAAPTQRGKAAPSVAPRAQDTAVPAPASTGRDAGGEGIGHALGRVETEEEAFGSMLRRELHARGLTPSTPETIDLTDDGPGQESAPVPVGPAVARPLRPSSSAAAVPPPPVPPEERFRLDEPSGPTVGVPRPARPAAPLPLRTEHAADSARAALQDAVVVESQALVRPPRPTSAPPAAEPVPAEPVRPESRRPEPVRPELEVGAPDASIVESDDAAIDEAVIDPGPASVEPASVEPAPVPATEPETTVDVRSEAVVATRVGADVQPVNEPSTNQTSNAIAVRTVEPMPDTPPGLGSVRWSVDRLAHLGLPFALVQRTVGLDPADDQRWLLTLAAGLADFVYPEPAGSAVFAGPRADRIGVAMELPVVEAPELPPYGGSVALKTNDDGAGRAWLARVRGDRVLHVVVGGRGWELLLAKDPDAVVVSSADSVLTGLQVSVEHDVPISYVSDADGLRRADALDLAIAVRSLVGRW